VCVCVRVCVCVCVSRARACVCARAFMRVYVCACACVSCVCTNARMSKRLTSSQPASIQLHTFAPSPVRSVQCAPWHHVPLSGPACAVVAQKLLQERGASLQLQLTILAVPVWGRRERAGMHAGVALSSATSGSTAQCEREHDNLPCHCPLAHCSPRASTTAWGQEADARATPADSSSSSHHMR